MKKILNFIKERMLEIAGLITVVIGISFLYLRNRINTFFDTDYAIKI